MKVNEETRRVVAITGHQQILTKVTEVRTSGSWTRIRCDEGYVIINPSNVLMYIIKGDVVS